MIKNRLPQSTNKVLLLTQIMFAVYSWRNNWRFGTTGRVLCQRQGQLRLRKDLSLPAAHNGNAPRGLSSAKTQLWANSRLRLLGRVRHRWRTRRHPAPVQLVAHGESDHQGAHFGAQQPRGATPSHLQGRCFCRQCPIWPMHWPLATCLKTQAK